MIRSCWSLKKTKRPRFFRKLKFLVSEKNAIEELKNLGTGNEVEVV